MSDGAPVAATASQTVGPFFHLGLHAPDGRLAGRSDGGDPICVRIRVTDGHGQPVDDALIEVWQSGVFGRLATAEDGRCELETVRPRTVPSGAPGDGAGHIDLCVFARGLLRHLHTRIYFAGDPALESDPALALVPEERRGTLMAMPDPERPGTWSFDVCLQGPRETVFFDV